MSAYRYVLTREWGYGYGNLCWVMLNPSTADEMLDDPTIRRCRSFAQREGAESMTVVNLYAARATDPKMLTMLQMDVIGNDNDSYWRWAMGRSDIVVFAWGASLPSRSQQPERIRALAASMGVQPVCLGTTKAGHPRHPLYVAGDQPLMEFR